MTASHLKRGTTCACASGFTLIELIVVIFLIGIITAVVMPRLLPALTFSRLEGEARHLANYGRSAMAQATLFREEVKVFFDMDKQEYYATRLVWPEPEFEVEAPTDQLGLLSQMRAGGMFAGGDFGALLAESRLDPRAMRDLPEGFDDEAANTQFDDKFARFARRALEERAKNVIHDTGILSEIGPLFGPDDEFSLDEEQPEEVEFADPMLQRTRLAQGVWIESVFIDGVPQGRGEVEVVLSPLGLAQRMAFHLVNEDGDYFTVLWDPLTGGANVFQGREDVK